MNAKGFMRFQRAAKSTLKDVFTTGLRNCEDQSGLLGETTFISVDEPVSTRLFKPQVSGSARFDVIASWLVGGQKIAADQTCDNLGGYIKIEAQFQDAPFPVVVEWSRAYKNCVGIPIGLPAGCNSCPINADMVGAVLIARVTSQQSSNDLGCAFVEIGPFDMNGPMKQDLLEFYNSKKASFTVEIPASSIKHPDQPEGKNEELKIEVGLDKISFDSSANAEWPDCPITAGALIAQVDMHEPCVLYICDGNLRYKLAALSQRRRDIIVLCIRLFQALKMCHFFSSIEEIIRTTHQIYPASATPEGNGMRASDVDLLVIVDSLAAQTRLACEHAQVAQRAQAAAIRDRDALESDMREVITSYRSLMSNTTSAIPPNGDSLSLSTASKTAAAQQPLDPRSSAIMLELENNRKETLTLKRKLAEKSAELENWLKSSFPESPTQSYAATPDEIARHLDNIGISTTHNALAKDARLAESLDRDQMVSRIQTMQAEIKQLQEDKQFMENKYLHLESQQTRMNNSKCRTQSIGQKVDTVQAVHERELKNASDKIAQMKQRLEARDVELEEQVQHVRNLKLQLDSFQKFDASGQVETFTAMNRTMLQEPTIRDLHTTIPTGLEGFTQNFDTQDKRCIALQNEIASLRNLNATLKLENEKLKIQNTNLIEANDRLQQKLRDLAQNKSVEITAPPSTHAPGFHTST